MEDGPRDTTRRLRQVTRRQFTGAAGLGLTAAGTSFAVANCGSATRTPSVRPAGRGAAAGNIVYARPQTGLQSADIIYVTRIATSRFEEYGGRPPYANSTGSGKAVVLRDGRVYTVRWSRPNRGTGTAYTLPDGRRMLFAPGQTWVVLAPESHASYLNAARV
jgi:hypothetical protein